jgi:hypothetical protein
VKNKTFKYFIIDLFVGVLFTGFMLFYSQDFSLIGWLDAIAVAGIMLFGLGWFFYISNNNLFDMVIYGVKSFWVGIVGKRMKHSYIEYIQEKPQVASSIYKTLWFTGLIYEIIFLVLYLIYKF